jgi:23S rRNA (cytosine1962-C5)-methyltransferase
MASAILKPGRAKPFWYGHPWVFSEALARVEGEAAPGDAVELKDDRGRLIGRGFYNPRSQIRVRLLAGPDEEVDRALFARRLAAARDLRRDILGLPSPETTAYRLVNSEGDGLPGLTVDIFGDVAVAQLTSLGMKRREQEIFDALKELLAPRAIVEAAAPGPQELEGFQVTPGARYGELPGVVEIAENGLRYAVEPAAQKTGFYCDQRENRRRVMLAARGRRVLDAYSFTGGFGLNAARGGAAEVTCVDSSAKALGLARENFSRNGLSCRAIEADAFEFLERCKERFDLVVLDPPKFAKRQKDKPNALAGYRKLAAAGMRVLAPGGLLVACSCSGLVSEDEFLRSLGEGAYDAGRRLAVLSVSGAGPDHPVRLPWLEGRYLKCVTGQVL